MDLMQKPLLRALTLALAVSLAVFAQTAPVTGHRYARLAIRNAIVVDGAGTPAAGPYDILIENNRITAMVALDPVSLGRGARRLPADAEIDAKGKYVLPGLINRSEERRGGEEWRSRGW